MIVRRKNYAGFSNGYIYYNNITISLIVDIGWALYGGLYDPECLVFLLQSIVDSHSIETTFGSRETHSIPTAISFLNSQDHHPLEAFSALLTSERYSCGQTAGVQ